MSHDISDRNTELYLRRDLLLNPDAAHSVKVLLRNKVRCCQKEVELRTPKEQKLYMCEISGGPKLQNLAGGQRRP